MVDIVDCLCADYGNTHIGQSLRSLVALYRTIEEGDASFCRENGIACPLGCGTCCEHFDPDVTALEATLVAAYLLKTGRKIAVFDAPPCLLYDDRSSHHCTVYPVRPLVCRLFAACASRDKRGKAVFRRCRYNTESNQPKSLRFAETVPVMQDYAYVLRALDGGEEPVELLSVAVVRKMDELRFLQRLLRDEGSHPDDTPTTPSLAS